MGEGTVDRVWASVAVLPGGRSSRAEVRLRNGKPGHHAFYGAVCVQYFYQFAASPVGVLVLFKSALCQPQTLSEALGMLYTPSFHLCTVCMHAHKLQLMFSLSLSSQS